MTRPGNAQMTTSGANRSGQVLQVAARLFNARGLAGASMRDIAGAAGIRASSLYHFFPGKEQLFLAVYTEGVRRIRAAVEAALCAAPSGDSWKRLEAAAAAHLEALLAGDDFAALVVRSLPAAQDDNVTAGVARLRDDYETIFRTLVADLPLAEPADRGLFRLTLLGALNWSTVWYRADGGAPPAEISRRIVAWLRAGAAEGTAP